MPFEKGNTLGNRFSTDNQPDTQGRTPGAKNRSTIARKVLEMRAIMPEEAKEKLRETHPDIEEDLTTEEIATIMIAGNAMAGDVKSYEALMNSAYGAPKQEVAQTVTNVNVLNNDPLNDTGDDSTSEDQQPA